MRLAILLLRLTRFWRWELFLSLQGLLVNIVGIFFGGGSEFHGQSLCSGGTTLPLRRAVAVASKSLSTLGLTLGTSPPQSC